MSITEKIKDIVMGPKKTVVIDKIEEGMQNTKIRYVSGFEYFYGGLADGFYDKTYGHTIGRKVNIKFKEAKTNQKFGMDCYVIDEEKGKNCSQSLKKEGYYCRESHPHLITEEELATLTKLTGESLEIRVKRIALIDETQLEPRDNSILDMLVYYYTNPRQSYQNQNKPQEVKK